MKTIGIVLVLVVVAVALFAWYQSDQARRDLRWLASTETIATPAPRPVTFAEVGREPLQTVTPRAVPRLEYAMPRGTDPTGLSLFS